MPDPAVVFPVGHPRAIAVVRSLGRAGIPVVGLDPGRTSPGLHSRYLRAKYQTETDSPRILDFLEELPGRAAGGVLFPTSDEALLRVAAGADRLGKRYRLAIPALDVLDRMIDRRRCFELAAEVGVRTPGWWAPADADALDGVLPLLDFASHDYLVKTTVGGAFADPETRRHTRLGGLDAAALRETWREVAARSERPPIIEQVVPGESDACIGVSLVLDANHDPVVAYAVRRLRLETYTRSTRFAHPYELGSNVYCESVHDPEAMEAARRLARAFGAVGAATFEFRRDPADGGLVLIKVDPRPVRSTSLSARLGMDVPLALYRLAVGGELPRPVSYPDRVGWLWTGRYAEVLRASRDASVRRELLSLVTRGWRVRAFAYASARDPLPWLRDLARLLPRRPRKRALRTLGRWHQRRVPVVRA